MYKPRIGVLRGGPSSEYDVSLKTGQTVLSHLPRGRYDPLDILIDKNGRWHMRGRPVEPARALDQCDALFNALHGAYGEDGTVQRLMDTHGARYTGSGALGSGIAMNKVLSKRHLAQVTAGQNEPKAPPARNQKGRRPMPSKLVFAADVVLTSDTASEDIQDVLQKLSTPLVVKPATGGSSVATAVVTTPDELLYAVMNAFEYSDTVLVEQFVRGREVTVAVAEDFRNEAFYAFPPIEITPTKSEYFDYAEKYDGHAREVCPAPLPKETTSALLSAARQVHSTLGLRDYSRSDFILGTDGMYFLEVNTLPGLTTESLVPKAVDAVGASLAQFLDHLTTRALTRKK